MGEGTGNEKGMLLGGGASKPKIGGGMKRKTI